MIDVGVMADFERRANLGDQFKQYADFKVFDNIEEHILGKIEKEALDIFKSILPEESVRVAEAQMMYALAERFRSLWNGIIADGDYARIQLTALPKENYDEQ